MIPEDNVHLNQPKTWLGQELVQKVYPLGKLPSYLPEFRREPFGVGGNENEYLETIVRLPIGQDSREIPVATVSRRYALIQHSEVYLWLSEGLKAIASYSDDIRVEVVMSEYGERVHFAVQIDKFNFDPGDGFPVCLMIEARNSVDKSCAFELRLRWRRLVCMNGLWVQATDTLRKIHNIDWMNRKDVAKFIDDRVSKISGVKKMLTRWLNTKVSMGQIEEWVNVKLTKAWGTYLAARCYHIAQTGYDGIVGRAKEKTPASKYIVSSDRKVPGSPAPIDNLYHLSQVLTWLSNNRDTIEDSDTKTSDIPRLMHYFFK